MGRVLVTGAGGFIGSHVARHLAACSLDVVGHYRSSSLLPNGKANLRFVQGDLRNVSEVPFAPFEAVVHCAAAAGPWHTVDRIREDNIEATRELIHAAVKWDTALFILISSTSVYGHITDAVLTEDTLIADPDLYGQSKLRNEAICGIFGYRMPSVALRLPGVIGKGAHTTNWLPRVARDLKNGDTISIFNAEALFNAAVHVSDLCSFIETLLHRPQSGFQYANLGARDPLPTKEVVTRLARAIGVPSAIQEVHESPKNPYLISIDKVEKMGYVAMTMDEMIRRFAEEV